MMLLFLIYRTGEDNKYDFLPNVLGRVDVAWKSKEYF